MNYHEVDRQIEGATTIRELAVLLRKLNEEFDVISSRIDSEREHFLEHGVTVRSGPRRGQPLTRGGRTRFLDRLGRLEAERILIAVTSNRICNRAAAMREACAEVH